MNNVKFENNVMLFNVLRVKSTTNYFCSQLQIMVCIFLNAFIDSSLKDLILYVINPK